MSDKNLCTKCGNSIDIHVEVCDTGCLLRITVDDTGADKDKIKQFQEKFRAYINEAQKDEV